MFRFAENLKFFIFTPLILLISVACSVDNSVGYRNIVSILGGVWDFEDQEEYTFDNDLVEIIDGKAQLKEVDQSHSGDDFRQGTHVGTYYDLVSNRLKISNSTDKSLSIREILPEKNSSLVAYWPFENNTQDESHSPTSHNLTATGGPSFSTMSKIGKYSVDYSTAGYHRAQDHAEFDSELSGGFAVSLWYYHTSTAATERLIGKMCYDGSWKDTSWGISKINTGALQFIVTSDGSTFRGVTLPFSLLENDWYHVVAVYDGNFTKLYIDGIHAVSNSIGAISIYDSNLDLTIGRRHDGAGCSSSTQPVQGFLDDIAIWKAPLSHTEVRELYDGQSQKYTELLPAWTPHWDNIIGYWKMDGNWQDSSGNGNHGAAAGDPTFDSNSKVGSQAGLFDGTGDYVNAGPADFSTIQEGTMASWFRTSDVGSPNMRIIEIGLPTNRIGIFKSAVSNRVGLYINKGAVCAEIYAPEIVNDGKWHHVMATFSGNSLNVYMDGVKSISSTTNCLPFNLSGGSNLFIGQYVGLGGYEWDGALDEVVFWSKAVGPEEVQLIYNRQKQKFAAHYDSPVIDLGASGSWTNIDTVSPLPFGKEIVAQTSERSSDYSSLSGDFSDGLIGYWKFNEDVLDGVGGADFEDHSGNNNHANETGGAVTNSNGILGRSVSLDGNDDFIQTGNFNFGATSTITYSCWFNTSKTGATQGLIYKSNSVMEVFLDTTGSIKVWLSNDVAWHQAASSPSYTDWDQWHHVAVTYDGTNVIIYRDGKVVTTSGLETGNLPSSLSFLRFSDATGGGIQSLQGSLDETAIWSRTLSASEIQQLYRRGANRLKYQVKSCVDSSCNCKEFKGANPTSDDCDGDGTPNITDADNENTLADFTGPGGNGVTSFSEFYNRDSSNMTFSCSNNTTDADSNVCVDDEVTLTEDPKVTSPSFSFFDYPSTARPADNRYFQYRVMMEAEENSACGGEPCMPELTSLEIGPTGRYFSGTPSIVNKASHPIDKALDNLLVDKSSSCNLSYQISNDGNIFYYWDGSGWTAGTSASQSNDLVTLNDKLSSFTSQIGFGDFYFKSYLGNANFGKCEIDKVQVIKSRSKSN